MLTLKEKMEIVNVIDKEKLATRAIASRFHIGKTQATMIARNKEDIRRLWQSGVNMNQKRSFFKTVGLNIDKTCFECFINARNRRIPIYYLFFHLLYLCIYLIKFSLKRAPPISGQKSWNPDCPLMGAFTVYQISDQSVNRKTVKFQLLDLKQQHQQQHQQQTGQAK